jgi:ribosomal protein S18 acetylase RimI-like enzyme
MDDLIITKAVKEDLPIILDIQRKTFLEVAKTFNLKSMPQIEQTLESLTDEFNHCIFLKASLVKTSLKKINAISDKSIHFKLKPPKLLDSGLSRNDEGNIKIAGSVRAYTEGDTCYISRLIVLPEYQNRGIGKALMSEIEKQFKNIVTRYELFTGSRDQRNLYRYNKLGYKPFKTEYLNSEITFVFMEKSA